MTLFSRTYTLVVGTRDVSALDIQFSVTRTLQATPNKAEIKVYNASPDTRAQWATYKKGHIPVSLSVGYKDEGEVRIFLGMLRTLESTPEGSDIITSISSGDGEETKGKRIKVTLPRAVAPDQALRAIVGALGVGRGNIEDAVRALRSRGVATLHGRGAVLSGPSALAMTQFCQSAGLEWSVQDGAVQILQKGEGLAGTALALSSDSGLIGSPTVDTKGVLSAVTLLIPSLVPGRIVEVDSLGVKGAFVVGQVEYTGETNGNEWYCKIQGKARK